MIRNYLLTAWRNLRSNKLNAIINISGLTVAFTVGILLFLMVYFELSYDRMHKNGSHLYKLYSFNHAPEGEERGTSMGYPIVPSMKTDVPGVVKATAIMPAGRAMRYKTKELDKNVTLVDNDFFSMFSFPVAAGSGADPLGGLGNIVLSRTTASALFGQEDPIGKTMSIKVGGVWKDLQVTAVLEDAPANSSINYNALARIELAGDYTNNKDNWNSQNHSVFVQISPVASQAQVEAQMRSMMKRRSPGNVDYMKQKGYRTDSNGEMAGIRLAPLSSMHFDGEIGTGGTVEKNYLYTMMLIAVIVLVIACFNFVNLNVARAFTRAKEVGVRKTIGAGRKQIFVQMWVESLLLFATAVVLALVLSALLLTPFNSLFVEKLTLSSLLQPGVIAFLLVVMLIVSFLAGGYPAWMVARFNTVEVLKGKVTVKRSGFLRNGLITIQFVMACLLICGTIVIYRQFQHMRTAPLGYTQESVISIPVKHAENGQRNLRQMRQLLASQPQVLSVTGSSVNIGIGEDHSQSTSKIGFLYNAKLFESEMIRVDYDFLETMDIKPLAGRGFSRQFASDTSSASDNVVISESMARQFVEKNLVGLSLSSDTSAPKWNIVGVIPDIHLHSMHEKVGALTLMMAKDAGDVSYILVKTRTQNPLQTMSLVRDIYKGVEPDNTISPSYISENTSRWYATERRLSTIFCSAAVIAILLSCLGLFAIVSLVIGLRRKEIGVRKVLGASVAGIAGLLSKDFLRLVVLAFFIATPIAWYFLNKWLQEFVYRVTISWWIFPLSGVVALLIALGTISILTIRASMANPVKNLRTE